MRCGVTCAEPSVSGCVASSSLRAASRVPPAPNQGSTGFTPAMGDVYTLQRERLLACHTAWEIDGDIISAWGEQYCPLG